jgi:hypothetical protein
MQPTIRNAVAGAWLLFRNTPRPWLSRFLWAGLASAASNGLLGSFIAFYLFSGVTRYNNIDSVVLNSAWRANRLSPRCS